MLRTSSATLPKPLAAGIGLVTRAPQALTELSLRLPSLAFVAVHEARRRYDEFARLGAEIVAKRTAAGEDQPAEESPTLYAVADDELGDHLSHELGDYLGDEVGDDLDAEGAPFATDTDPPLAAEPLPLAGFDALTLAQIRGRLSKLSRVEVEVLRDHESATGRRLPILTMLENRITKLIAEG